MVLDFEEVGLRWSTKREGGEILISRESKGSRQLFSEWKAI